MKIPVESVSSWQIALSAVGRQIILRPWVTKSGDTEEPAQHFALSLPAARALQRQLAESIQLLEEECGETPAPGERRKGEKHVPNDRRKRRHFEGSRSSKADPEQAPHQAVPPKTQK